MWQILICWLLWGIYLLESTAKRFKCPLDSQLIWIFPLFSKLHYYIYPCSNSIKSIKIYLPNLYKMWLILICWLLWGIYLYVGKYSQKIQMSTLDSKLIWIIPLISKLHYYIYPCSNSVKNIKIYLIKGDFFYIANIDIPSHYPELEIWISRP